MTVVTVPKLVGPHGRKEGLNKVYGGATPAMLGFGVHIILIPPHSTTTWAADAVNFLARSLTTNLDEH